MGLETDLRVLAEATVECLDCGYHVRIGMDTMEALPPGKVEGPGNTQADCGGCAGTGRKALFPLLRRKCPGCKGTGINSAGMHLFGCQYCSGTPLAKGPGWFPIESNDSALSLLMRALHEAGYYATLWWAKHESGASISAFDDGLILSHMYGDTPLEALATAMIQATRSS